MPLEIKPYHKDIHYYKQPKNEMLPKLNSSILFLAPTNSGKSVLISSLLLSSDSYRGCFEAIYIISPTVFSDPAYVPILEYCKKELKQENTEDETYFYDTYDMSVIQHIFNECQKMTLYMKKKKIPRLYSTLIILDDIVSDKQFLRSNKFMNDLFIKGRHFGISTWIASQYFKALPPIIRVNIQTIITFKLRSQTDYEALSESVSAILGKDKFHEIYNKAIQKAYDFLVINLMKQNINEIFIKNFKDYIIV